MPQGLGVRVPPPAYSGFDGRVLSYPGERVRRINDPPARQRFARTAIAVAAVATAAIAFAVYTGGDASSLARDEAAARAAQSNIGMEMSRLAARIAAPWVDRRAETGLFVDPITGGAGHGYGPAMLAEVLIREGSETDDRRMLRAGLEALSVNASIAATDGSPGNPLELFAIASAYRWGERNLGDDPDWRRWSQGPRKYLQTWESAAVGRAAQRCFVAPSCWNNYKIVDAASVLLLLDTGLKPASAAARLADPEGAHAAALSILERDLPRAIGHRASARGRTGTLTGLGLLADQPTYPLAYHAMSVAALARALQVLGDRAPATARESFRRAMLAQASFMGPDGDVTFLGRAQGESWALAATAYAGESCARMFETSRPRSAGICATLAIRAVARLKRLYGFKDGLLAIVPRFSNAPLSDHGLEHYARVMTFNGLTAMFFEWASEEARAADRVVPAPLPLDKGGSYADPDRARLAVVRRGSVWFAVHAIGPIRVNDLRYDFGVLSLKFRRGNRWVDVIPPRPFDDSGGLVDGGGPALVTASGLAFPRGTRFSVDPDTGEVVVHGGYRTATGVWALRGCEFRFKPSERGVSMTAVAPAGSVLRFQDYLPAAWTEAVDGARVLMTPTATSWLSDAPSTLDYGLSFASANALQLQGYRRYVTVPASGRVSWTLAARSLPRGYGGR